ncbi:MAG: hypothetical protein ABSB57_03770 [Dehalococcoidia bacterium]
MGRNFQTILDECLKELETGQSLDAILARYPEEADELRPLLLTAQNLKSMPIARPRSHVQQAGWQRFLGQAIALRRARQRRPALSLWRPLAAAASFVLMLFLAGGATTYAASRSLPDSPSSWLPRRPASGSCSMRAIGRAPFSIRRKPA